MTLVSYVAPDGQRFLGRVPVGHEKPPLINVVLDWTAELK